MPELPEVEVVRAGLERHVVGATITSVEVLHPRPVRRDPRGPAGFAAALTGRRDRGRRRRGKYFWLPLDNGDALLGHLGMSGQMLVQPPGGARRAAPAGAVRACDRRPRAAVRRPADVRRARRLRRAEPSCRRRSPTSPATRSTRSSTTTTSYAACAGARPGSSGCCSTRRLVSGVGNIYADEALWRARIHGERPGDRLTGAAGPAAARPRPAAVMAAALGQGGTSFDALYVNVNGESGYFDRSLHAYGREGEPCDRCGTPIRRVAFTNRSSYFCPPCQPAPRRRRRRHLIFGRCRLTP